MDFSNALLAIKDGQLASRSNWNGQKMYVGLVSVPYAFWSGVPDSNSYRPFLFMKTVNDEFVPWVATQTDLLEDDWYIVEK